MQGLINVALIVSRRERQEEAGGEAETREALPGLHKIEPAILPRIYPAPIVAFRKHR